MRRFVWVLQALCLVAAVSCPAMAQVSITEILSSKSIAWFAAALAIGLGAFGTGLGQGNAINGAMGAIGRNPEAAGTIRGVLILGLAFIESLCIYALVIAFILQGKG
ncbi:MAG TPA: ATP synthase F0 subunit C [Candidatus Nitrosotenuis sp.]|jgi:F-type H+-transporting ATPase subunit c|nr:ATP synthase F0 subunit C [Candidatus Nitrosotenuis sp.]